MEHGYAKLLKRPEAFASILHALAVPGPYLMAWLTILTELLGGFAVLLGAFVPLVSDGSCPVDCHVQRALAVWF
jgi:putative oxidoreductase